MQFNQGFDMKELIHEAQSRWLMAPEVHFILQNHEFFQLTESVPQKPAGGSLHLYNKRVVRYFRKDGHDWRKKKNGKTAGEGHEKLKVGDVVALNCYYAHGEPDPKFQRRSYWMLDPAYEHIVLVHYRDTSKERHTVGLNLHYSPGCSSALTSGIHTPQNQGSFSVVSGLINQSPCSFSPGSLEVSSESLFGKQRMNHLDETNKNEYHISSPVFNSSNTVQQPAEQLGMQVEDTSPDSGHSEYEAMFKQSGLLAQQHRSEHMEASQLVNGNSQLQYVKNTGPIPEYSGEDPFWKDLYGLCESSSWTGAADQQNICSNLTKQQVPTSQWLDQSGIADNRTHQNNLDYYKMSSDQHNQLGVHIRSDSLSQRYKFKIRDVSPEWGYASESTKVLICGSFLCDPPKSAWTCMFGDVEVPLQIVQEGVFSCYAPPQFPQKVHFYISSSDQEQCSEMREFEYRREPGLTPGSNKNTEELLLLIRFAQMLFSDQLVHKENIADSVTNASEDPWGHMIQGLLLGTVNQPTTTDWLLVELMKDKLQKWLLCKSQMGVTPSKKEPGMIHLVAGLGFEWALVPILDYGVNVNFRDVNGWTALHWAARFGREKIVSALIAAGASAGAVTDPTSEDPVGKTPGFIASFYGHKGLAGYLSEMALSNHLFSLTLEESESSKGYAAVETERTADSISQQIGFFEDQVSLRDSLDAVRNAAQAAARIQFAFREHSFRRRQQREVAIASYSVDGITPEVISVIVAASKISSKHLHDYVDKAALSIQKKYRGWRGRQMFLNLRQKIITIQAHVRGYQVRKKYKVVLWAVGVLEKIVLRWRRKGEGLRGFKTVSEPDCDAEYEDIIKIFRKKKVDVTIEKALSRVVSMVKSPSAQKQYHRMLESYREAKADLLGKANETALTSQGSGDMMGNDEEDLILASIGTIFDYNNVFPYDPYTFLDT